MESERILIDTSILIDHLRRSDKARTALYRASTLHECAVSAVTEFEFRVGSTGVNRDFVAQLLEVTPVLPFDSMCVLVAADIHRDLKSRNRLIGLPDLFIAATAVAHHLPSLTLNLSHFERVNSLRLLSLSDL